MSAHHVVGAYGCRVRFSISIPQRAADGFDAEGTRVISRGQKSSASRAAGRSSKSSRPHRLSRHWSCCPGPRRTPPGCGSAWRCSSPRCTTRCNWHPPSPLSTSSATVGWTSASARRQLQAVPGVRRRQGDVRQLFHRGPRADEGGVVRRADGDLSRPLPRCRRPADPTQTRAAPAPADLVRRQRTPRRWPARCGWATPSWARARRRRRTSPKRSGPSAASSTSRARTRHSFTIGKRVYLTVDDDGARARERVLAGLHRIYGDMPGIEAVPVSGTPDDVVARTARGRRRRRRDDPAQPGGRDRCRRS